jgi:Rad3-related DNA helicase
MEKQPTSPRWEEIGDANIPLALTVLCQPLPEMLYCPYDVATGCFLYRKIEASEDCGLIAFLAPDVAQDYIRTRLRRGAYSKVRQVSLDEAHDLALARHAVVNCLIVVQPAPMVPPISVATWHPSVHYVR